MTTNRRLVLVGSLGLIVALMLLVVLAFGSGRGREPLSASGRPTAAIADPGAGDPAPAALFSSTSVWNEPLDADARVDPRSARIVSSLAAEERQEASTGVAPWIATSQCSTPLYVVPAGEPLARVDLLNPHAAWRRGLARAFNRVPLPGDARPADCVDQHLTVWQPSSDRLWEFFHLRRVDGSWMADWGGAMDHVSESPGFYSPSSWPGLSASNWGATATSLPVIGGVMLLHELRAGQIDHALAINVPVARARAFSWPAQRSDGIGPPSAIPEGARLRLDPTLDLSKLQLPPMTRMIALAAQRYGLIVRDQTGAGNGISLFAQDLGPEGNAVYNGSQGLYGGLTPSQLLALFPWSRLQLMQMKLCTRAPCRR